MNKLDRQITKIIEKYFDFVQERIENGPSQTYDDLYNTLVPKIKQSILKAIMEKSLKTKELHDNCSCSHCLYTRFRNRNLEEFESVIKEILQTKTNE